MKTRYQIVASAENTPYMGWQCKLFYFSCVTRLNHQPIIIVHDSGRDWHPDFHDLAKAGCAIYPAPSYRVNADGYDYACRNQAGSLIHAADLLAGKASFIVLCDTDMIFATEPQFPDALSGDFCSYMDFNKEYVSEPKRKLGIERELSDAEKEALRCGVPYVIPIKDAPQIGRTWLEAMDLFESHNWGNIMYAFGLAVTKLGLNINLTHLVDHNYWPDEKLNRAMIHYCHENERWNKREYWTTEGAKDVWNSSGGAPRETIHGELLAQIREARDFYRDVYFPA